jgi:hypothetical protein
MKAAGKIGLLTIVSPVNRDRHATKVVALPFALLSVEAGRDTDETLAVRKKLSGRLRAISEMPIKSREIASPAG